MRRLRKKNGYSIAESLLALLIVVLLSTGIAAGIAFATRQYNASLSMSESKVLCSSLTNILRSELSTTRKITVNAVGKVVSIQPSPNYRTAGVAETEAEKQSTLRALRNGVESSYGELMLGEQPLLPTAAYSSYELNASADVRYDDDPGIFEVTLTIYSSDGSKELVSNTFEVIPLNEVQILPNT